MYKESGANKMLELKLFGTFDILFDNKTIFNKGKHTNKIFEILKYMIINNDKELSPEIICENIWPDTEYLDVRNTVTTYVFRLNKFLKESKCGESNVSTFLKIVCQKGSYRLTVSEECVVDIKRFNEYYEKAEMCLDQEEKIRLIKAAIDLYQGELLSDSNFDSWVTPYRNYYRRIFSELNRTILSIYQEQKNYKEILKLCKRIFEVCPLDEYSNLYYLKALYELNYISEALTHYEYITGRFVSEMGIQPSEEMKELYHAIKTKRGTDIADSSQSFNFSQFFNEDSEFWNMFSNAIDEYMDKKAETKSYSIGYTVIENIHEDDFPAALSAFVKAVQTVLRKEDCYTFFEPNVVIFVLNDVPEVFFSLIKERIEKIFKENYRKEMPFSITISPCVAYNRNK